MHVLEVKNLIRNYQKSAQKKSGEDIKVLKGLNFAVDEGEFVGIMGKSGCGKTTLLKVLGMIDKQTDGEVFFMEQNTTDLYGDKLADIRRTQIGFIFQDFYLMDSLTVEENICICDVPLKGIFTDKKRIKEKSLEILEVMKLENIATKKVEDLAPNQQYMVELAKALVQEPKLLIIDEITSALYREDVEIVDDIIKDLKKKG